MKNLNVFRLKGSMIKAHPQISSQSANINRQCRMVESPSHHHHHHLWNSWSHHHFWSQFPSVISRYLISTCAVKWCHRDRVTASAQMCVPSCAVCHLPPHDHSPTDWLVLRHLLFHAIGTLLSLSLPSSLTASSRPHLSSLPLPPSAVTISSVSLLPHSLSLRSVSPSAAFTHAWP